MGEAHQRREEYGKALKKYHAVAKFFDDWLDDQLDFHTYCLRKMTLVNYIRYLSFLALEKAND